VSEAPDKSSLKVANAPSEQPDTRGIENISIIEKTEIYATGSIAVAFAFSVSAQQPFVSYISATIPICVAIVGYLRWRGIDSTIKTINDYLEILGTDLPHGGWTKYYRAKRGPALRRSRNQIWLLLIMLSTLFFVLTIILGPFTKSEEAAPSLQLVQLR
jgi:hypothetical protein